MPSTALRTEICDRFGVEYPIFGFSHSADVVIAVCRAGGIGVWGGTRNTPAEIEENLRRIAAAVAGRPFGVDLVIPAGMPERNNREEIEQQLPDEHRAFVDGLWDKYAVPRDGQSGARSRFVRSEESARRQVEVVLESDASLFALGVGSPLDVIAAAKDRGKTIVSLVGQPRHAERALAAGTDILVAQGTDAGAHTGPIGTFSLVPQIAAVSDVPVLAAGGVATGRHIAAALALGAVGVWIGTAWLLTEEAHLGETAARQLQGARSTDTVITRSDSGKTLRVVRSAWTDEWEADDAPVPLQMPLQDILVGDILGSIDRHEVEQLVHHPAGQGIAWFNERTTVAEVMARFVEGADETLEGLSR